MSCLPKVMLSPIATTTEGSLSPKSLFIESLFEQPAPTASSTASTSLLVRASIRRLVKANMGAHYSQVRPA